MSDGLTTEENEVLANYHLNILKNYLHLIEQNVSFVNKKPNIKLIEKRIEQMKRELEIIKIYNDKIEKANDN